MFDLMARKRKDPNRTAAKQGREGHAHGAAQG
jgi:hypothetical protein